MYAIVTIAGQQFKVEKGKKVIVHQLQSAVGDEMTFEKVLLVEKEGQVSVGSPYVKDTAVKAQVLSHLRGDKIKVFKKKRRKGYQVLNGHRQYFTELLIEEIGEGLVAKKAVKPAKEEEPKTEVVKEAIPAVVAEPKAKKPAAKKETEPKVAATKAKPSAPKTAKKETTPKTKPAVKKEALKSKPAAKKEVKPGKK
jgi:large subunit ribosomal protein L21